MIFDKVLRRVFNSGARLTLDDPTGWTTGGHLLFGGKAVQAMCLPAVNACIEILSDSVAKMPIFVMDSRTRERQPEHPILSLLASRPTEALTPFDYAKLVESRRIAYGNSYVLINRGHWGEPVELIPIPPGYMLPYRHTDGNLWYIGIDPKTNEYRKFWPADILHYKAFSSDGLEGISYLQRGREIIEAGMQAQKYEVNFYKNGQQLSGVLSTDTDLDQRTRHDADGNPIDIKNKIREAWEKIHAGSDNAYRIAVLDNGLKFTPITATNRDAQFIENKAASIEDIGRLFNIPLYKLGVGQQTYASNVQAAIEFMQRSLSPIVTAYEQEDTYKLLTTIERTDRHLEIRRNMMGELRGDWAARGAWYKTMREIGAYNVNDILALEDMPDKPGGGDCYASLNYVPLELFRELSLARNQPQTTPEPGGGGDNAI